MNIKKKFGQFEKAQVLPTIVVVLLVLITFSVLVVDGGSIMLNRRSAQAAADAGALAGARAICTGASSPIQVANDYTLMNGASSAVATIIGTNQIEVVADVENLSFFAKIIGEDNLMANAEAVAGCYHPSVARRVLPVAFYYESPPVNAEDAVCDEDGTCNLVNWDFDELMNALSSTSANDLPLDNIYVVSEKTKVCEKSITGVIVCSEMAGNASGGNRSWIDLGDSNLKKIIKTGISNPIHTPAWLNAQPGVSADVYNGATYTDLDPIEGYTNLEARMFFVPVFDEYCEKDPQNLCSSDANDRFEYLVSINQASYRLIGFGPFVVTCVTKNEKCEFGTCIPNENICPGYKATNPSKKGDAIEGYFVNHVPYDEWVWGTEGVDVGIYLVSLSN